MDLSIVTGIITGTIVALISIWLTQLYAFYISYDAMITEIEANWCRISEIYFISNLFCRVVYDPGDGNHWLPKTVSLKAANLIPRQVTVNNKANDTKVRVRSFLYQYLSDNAFIILLSKGYALNIKSLNRITVFYNHCNKFNHKSQLIEERIRDRIENGEDPFYEIAEIITWYTYYRAEIETEYDSIKYLVEEHRTIVSLSWGIIVMELFFLVLIWRSY